jgi:hypothetical protein
VPTTGIDPKSFYLAAEKLVVLTQIFDMSKRFVFPFGSPLLGGCLTTEGALWADWSLSPPVEWRRYTSTEITIHVTGRQLLPYPANQMRMWEISRRVNSPKNDNPSLWEPLHAEPAQTTSAAVCAPFAAIVTSTPRFFCAAAPFRPQAL